MKKTILNSFTFLLKANRIKLFKLNMKFIFTTLFVVIFSFFINSQILSAKEFNNSNQLEKDSLDNIEKIKDTDKSSNIKKSDWDIFGDEQTFPFVAGLGKNAAH